MQPRFKHSYMVITTTFDLEPVLNQYMDTYPEGRIKDFEIVFKAVGEREDRPNETSYIVIFTNGEQEKYTLNIYHFIKSYCQLNNQAAVARPVNNVLPSYDPKMRQQPQGTQVFGNWADFLEE